MAERGSTKHGPGLDDQMKHETDGMVKGNQPAHVEEFRETDPFPDDTDSPEVWEASRQTGAKEPPEDSDEEG
ncbi:MAG TPA: hypothetical protein VGN49_13030 [Micrococcaceae bacterium]|jgi:hypothetical protein|nr:hypothetical protein [Micrococcaceae bacterium]